VTVENHEGPMFLHVVGEVCLGPQLAALDSLAKTCYHMLSHEIDGGRKVNRNVLADGACLAPPPREMPEVSTLPATGSAQN
jgi:hypothetical protein